MSTPLVLTDCQVFVGPGDFTGSTNSVALDMKGAELDRTTFGSNGWRERQGGLQDVTLKQDGWVTWPTPDDTAFAHLSQNNSPVTVVSSLTNGVAYVFQAMRSAYSILGAVGDQAPFSGMASGSHVAGVGRGALLLPKGTISGTTTGADFVVPAAAERVVVGVHVFTAGTTATMTVQSATSAAYTSPVTVASKVLTSTASSQFIDVEGASANTHYRVNWSAVTGSFVVAVSLGVV